MRSRYRITQEDGLYFVTSTIVEWIPIFTSKPYFDIVVDALRFCRASKDLKLYAFVILENHFHLVVSGPELSKILQSLKRHTSRQIIQLLEAQSRTWLLNQLAYYKKKHKTASRYQVWQEGFHPELITSEQMLVQKVDYLHVNPVKRGYVDYPEHWRYSSARNFLGEGEIVLEVDPLPT